MSPDKEQPTTLLDVVNVLQRHRKRIVTWCLFVIVLSVAALFLLPKRYSSTAKLFVRLGRESVSLDPTATTGQTIQVVESRENQINSARDMLKSRVMFERIVDHFGPDVILKGPANATSNTGSSLVSSLMGLIPSSDWFVTISQREKAIEKLSKAVTVEVARNSSVIDIKAKAKTPELAQEILQEYLSAYQDQYLVANRTSGSQSFFATQAAMLKKQLDESVAKLRDLKSEAGLVSIPAEQLSLQTEMMQVESGALTAAAALASSEASVAKLRELLIMVPGTVPLQQTSGFPNVAADSMRQELFKAQMTLREMEAKLGNDHPDLAVAREQVKNSEAILAQQAPERAQSTHAVNPSYQAIDLDLRREEAKAAALRAQHTKILQQHVQLQERLKALNANEVQIEELQREVSLAEDNYRRYTENLEQARIDQAIEANRISNVNIVQPPSLVEKPSSPRPLFVAAFALVACVGGSLLLSFGSEYLNSSPKTKEDVQSVLGVPVLATIPHANSDQHVFLNN